MNVQPRRTLALSFSKMKGEMILIKKEEQILKTHDHRKIYKDIYQIKPGKTIIQQLPELKYVSQRMTTSYNMNWDGRPEPIDERWLAWKVVNQIKQFTRNQLEYKFKLMPPEIIWHEEKDNKWLVDQMMVVADCVTDDIYEWALNRVIKNLRVSDLPTITFVKSTPILCAQRLHDASRDKNNFNERNFLMKSLRKAFVVTFSCLFLLMGCVEENNQVIQESKGEIISYESESTLRLETLEDLIRISDNIVIGIVTDEVQYSGSTLKFTFTVNNELKGNVDAKSIDVYEYYGDLEKGKEYILFLEFWEDELYPRPVYTSYNKGSLIEVNRNTLLGGETYVGNKTKDEMIEYIKSSKEVSVFSEKEDAVIEKAKDLAQLISISDHILHIVPKEVIHENMYVKTVGIEVLQKLKGSLNYEINSLNLPATIDLEKEYIVFLKENDGLGLATRDGSVVSKDNEALWQDILDEFVK